MKLQTKLLLGLLGGLLAVYLVSFWFQQHRSLSAIDAFSATSRASEEARQRQWVESLQTAMRVPLLDAMAEGDMATFARILASQRDVGGLQEFSLYNADGRVVASTDPARKRQELPAELKQPLLLAGQPVKRRSQVSFEIYEPLHAEKRCLECHVNQKEGQVNGIMAMRFSATALQAAEQNWVTFARDFRKNNLLTAIFTGIGLIVAVGVLVSLSIRYLVTVPLGRVSRRLSHSADGVSFSANSVGAASQALAGGASEQAASLEETSASLEEISCMTKRNADNAAHSISLSQQASQSATAGLERLTEMSRTLDAIKAAVGEMQAAVSEMQSSSQEISKIIKTIDEIAFQTNLLALNAAVEAARAGEAGAGFAVVADEVRALAQRSAQAARDTSDKIEAAVKRSELGGVASAKVVTSLGEVEATAHSIEQVFNGIVAQIKALDAVIAEIAAASKEQSQGVGEVNMAVGQMDKVTQSNAASAEENASAAEELNTQVGSLRAVVGELQIVVGGTSAPASEPAANAKPVAAPKVVRAARASGPVPPDRDIPLPQLAGHGSPAPEFKDF